MPKKQIVLLKRSGVADKVPTADQLEYGEIAINYAAGHEAIYMKNSDGNIVKFTGAVVVTNS